MGIKDDINLILRDHEGYTGDGRGGVGELPIGDRSTARKPISKRDLREVLGAVHDSVADPADAAMQAAGDAIDAAERAELAAAGVEYPVSYAPQTLTAPQRAQARSNINTLEEMRLYGVGSLSNVPQGGGLDMDDPAIPGGEYAVGPDVSPATIGTWPDGLSAFHGVLIVHRRASTTGIQYLEGTANSETTSRTWRRRFTSGVFQPWVEIPSRGFASPAEALAGTATDKVMSPARVREAAVQATAEQALGVGQEWVDVSGSRVAGTAYQNTTGRSIMVAVALPNTSGRMLQVSVNGTTWVTVGWANPFTAITVIPPGNYYRVVGGYVASQWAELR